MKISVQIESLDLLQEAIDSSCDSIRFGSEFCEYKLPTRDVLEKAYEVIKGKRKEFICVTPRLSNYGIKRVRKLLSFLDEQGSVAVVINDLGLLNIIADYPSLLPRLGRQLIRVPARSPWIDQVTKDADIWTWRWYKKVLATTSLNYPLTIRLLKSYGVEGADIDCITNLFPSFVSLMKRGLDLYVHLNSVPITMTRKCHTARFLGEKNHKRCSRPCLNDAFWLRNKMHNLEFYLYGNVVLNFTQFNRKDLKKLKRIGVAGLIVPLNPITGIANEENTSEFIASLTKN